MNSIMISKSSKCWDFCGKLRSNLVEFVQLIIVFLLVINSGNHTNIRRRRKSFRKACSISSSDTVSSNVDLKGSNLLGDLPDSFGSFIFLCTTSIQLASNLRYKNEGTIPQATAAIL